jgi:hypothetical protein
MNIPARLFPQNLLDCGGPPQTNRSSGRQRGNNADRLFGRIEFRENVMLFLQDWSKRSKQAGDLQSAFL